MTDQEKKTTQQEEELRQEAIVKGDLELPESPLKTKPNGAVEAVIWNSTGINMSVGVAMLQGDQLHIDIRKTCDLPKTLPQDTLDRLVLIKPTEGSLFKLTAQTEQAPKTDNTTENTTEEKITENTTEEKTAEAVE